MKKILLLLIFIISCSVIFTACDDFSTPQRGYDIGREYVFGDTLKFKIENDIENEQFVITYECISENDEKLHFSFGFNSRDIEVYKYDPLFQYSDNLGSEITFNEYGCYYFTGDRTFYVSYKNASEEIKTVIANNEYSISSSCGEFFAQD